MSEVSPNSIERLNEALAGRYRLRHKVGEGGMAIVYAADDLRHDRTVAIKILKSDMIDSTGAERFLREIQVVAKLSHPHILPLLDSGLAGTQPFYVMPFIEGDSLAGYMERVGPLSLEETVRISHEIARGLAYAHEQGLVHRDIKPENILLSSGQAVIADFGIAQAVSNQAAATSRLTKAGSAVGTAHYMSPEQWTGATVDGRSDQYSLACMVYQMLVGEPPFTGFTPQIVLARHLQGTIPQARIFRQNVTETVDNALSRALAKVPADRFTSVLDFAEALEIGLKVPSGSGTGRVTGPTLAPAERVSRRWVATLAVAGLSAGLALVVWSLSSRGGDLGHARLVVLPFETQGAQDREYFAEGIAEEITNRLGGIASLGVVARTSARLYAGTSKTPREIGDELNVQYLVEGSVRWNQPGSGMDSVRVTASLLRAEDSEVIWSDVYDVAALSGVIQVQANIAEEVTNELDVVLGERERARLAAGAPTNNAQAYDHVLRGNAAYDRSWSRPDVELSLENYQRAVELDPEFALGWAKLSRTLSWMNQLRFDLSENGLARAKEAADRALELDPELPEAHLAAGLYHYWGRDDYDRALAEFEIARQLKPSDGQIHVLIAAIRRRQGRFAEALESFQESVDLDPRSARVWFNLGETFLFTRDYAAARPPLEKALELAPDFLEAYVQLARLAVNESGDLDEARAVLASAEERIAPTAWRAPMLDFARIIYDPNLETFLTRLRPGAYGLDSATYYVAKATLLHQTRGRVAAVPQYDSARVLLTRMRLEAPGQAWIHALLGTVHAGLDEPEEAIGFGRRAVELLPSDADALDGPEFLSELATIYVMLGDMDKAAQCFDRALAMPSWISTHSLRVDPFLEPLHDTPQFQALVAKWSETGGATLTSPVGPTSCP